MPGVRWAAWFGENLGGQGAVKGDPGPGVHVARSECRKASVAQNGRTEQGGELLYFDQLGGFQGQTMSFSYFSYMHKDAGESRFTVTLHF